VVIERKPELAAAAERIHEMTLKEAVNSIVVADALEALLKARGTRKSSSGFYFVEYSKSVTSYNFIS
jgi:hypothetical protein